MKDSELVSKFFAEGYTAQNYGFILECLADDYIDHSPAGARGNTGAVEILKIVAKQFSSLTASVLDMFAADGMVTVRIRFEGVHTGTWMGIPATGKRVCFEALEHFRIADGKILESWGCWPDSEITRQLLEQC